MLINMNKWIKRLLPLLLLSALIISAAGQEKALPQIIIMEPKENAELSAGDVNVSVEVGNFALVNKLGKANVAGEGHIHYYMDAKVPTAPDKPALSTPGTYAPTMNTTYTWKNVAPGMHNFSVQLVNNDHTPLIPLVIDQVNVTVKADTLKTMSAANVTVDIMAKNIAFNMSTITVPAGSEVTVNFDNQDASVAHNVAFYETSAADKPIYVGAIFQGPKMMVYKFKAPDKPGTYFFRCDVHPGNMNGQFIVQ
jgi:plastocyanin